MNYVPGIPENEIEHEAYCDLIVNGPSTQLIDDSHIVWQENEDKIILVTDSSPIGLKKVAGDLSTCANREMHYDGGIYRSCDPPDERQIHLFIYSRADRAIGLLIFELRTSVWRCVWDAANIPKCIESPGHSPMWSVGFIWVQRQNRKKGLSKKVLLLAQQIIGLKNGEFGWYTPFTRDGKAFVRKLCPIEFFVAK